MEELGTKVGSCYIDVKLNTPNNNAITNLNNSIKQKFSANNVATKVGIKIDDQSLKKSQSILRGLSRDIRGLGGDIAALAKIPVAGLIGSIATFKIAGDKSTEAWRKYDLQLKKLKDTIAELGQKMLQINIFGKNISEWTELLSTSIKNIPVNRLESLFGLATKAMIFGNAVQFLGSSLRTIKEVRGMKGDIGELIGKKSTSHLPIQPTLPVTSLFSAGAAAGTALNSFLPSAAGTAAGSVAGGSKFGQFAKRQIEFFRNNFESTKRGIIDKGREQIMREIEKSRAERDRPYAEHLKARMERGELDKRDSAWASYQRFISSGLIEPKDEFSSISSKYTPPKFRPKVINTIPDVSRIMTGIPRGFSKKDDLEYLRNAAKGLSISLADGLQGIKVKLLAGLTVGFNAIKGFTLAIARFIPITAGFAIAIAAIKGAVSGLAITAKRLKVDEEIKAFPIMLSALFQTILKSVEEIAKSILSWGESGNPFKNVGKWFKEKFVNEANAGNVELVNAFEQKRINIEKQIKDTYDNLDKFTNDIYRKSLAYSAGQSAPKILEEQISYYNDWITNKQNEANIIKKQLDRDKDVKAAGREGLSDLSIKSYTDLLEKISKDIEERRTEVEALNQELLRKEIEAAKDKISYLDRIKEINDKIKENQEKRADLNIDIGNAAKETLANRYSLQADKDKSLAQASEDYKREMKNATKGDIYTQKSSVTDVYDVMQRSIEKFSQDKKDIKTIKEDYDKQRFEITKEYYKKVQENSDAYYAKEEKYREELLKNDAERTRIEQERVKLDQEKEMQNRERHSKNIEVLNKLNDLINLIKTPEEGVL